MIKKLIIIGTLLLVGTFLSSSVFAISDIAVFQGQYYNETSFINGTFEFTFDVYDAGVGGNLVGSHSKNLTTGNWGQWRAEVPGVSAACNDSSKDYFIEVLIDGVPQLPRKRLNHFNYMRKDVDEVTSGAISSSGSIGAQEYTFSAQEGQSMMDSYFNFVGPNKGDLIRISPREDFLGFPNATSIFVISENKTYVGMTHFVISSINLSNSWVWSDIHGGAGGFALIDTEDVSLGKEYIVKGAFANDRLSLGGVSNNPQGESSAGMDFIIYKDANGTKSFFVDSANSYATTINALLNVTDAAYFDDVYVNGLRVCLEDGTNCQIQNISFSENDTLQTITDRGSTTINNITVGSVLNFVFGGFIQEFADRFFVSKDLEVDGNVTADYYIGDGSYLTGIIGQPGPAGANGSQGIQGISGVNGTDGVDGIDGTNGSQGIQGIQGIAGADGIDGVDGVNGTDGMNGTNGSQGIQGEAGINGTNGIDGVNGSQGIQGEAGTNGTDGDSWFSLVSGWLSYVGNLFIDGNINASGNIYSNNKLVCLEDGTNCQVASDTNCSVSGSCGLVTYDSELNYTVDTSASVDCSGDQVLLGNGSCISSSGFGEGSFGQYVSFISTVDGDLKTGPKYLPLGTDSPISGKDDEASWIIDRDLTITGFLWNAKSNNMNGVAEIILIKSTSNKDSFSETSLSEDIQGVTTGSTIGSVSFSQGDLAAIKYSSSGSGTKKIKDLSITLIGTYD